MVILSALQAESISKSHPTKCASKMGKRILEITRTHNMTIVLSKSQQNIIDRFPAFLMNDDQEMTISGFAGSGKSFLVKYLADMGEKQQKLVKLLDPNIPYRTMYFTATTNKAASVLRAMLGREVRTIHSLLGLKVQNDYKTGRQRLTDNGKAENTRQALIFIDEASMVNRELLKVIRKRVKSFKDCKAIFIGDSYQLPPVMEDVCPVFDTGPNMFNLDEIQRQAAGSPIIQLSAKYRNMLDDHTLNWPDVKTTGNAIVHYTDKMDFFKEIEKRYTTPHESDDYKVVAWSNTRVRDYNTWIRSLQGRKQAFEIGEKVVSNKPLFEGRNILAPTDSFHTITNVQTDTVDGIQGYWLELNGFNGINFFQPHDWRQADKLAKIFANDKQWEPYFNIKERWADLRPVHASTVHKAQGSTYREVFVDLNNIGKNTRWREVARLVYVAITRASHTVHVYGGLHMNYNKSPAIDLMEPFKNVQCL